MNILLFAGNYTKTGSGLRVWKSLDTVATDDQSIEFDRLCRLLDLFGLPHGKIVLQLPLIQADQASLLNYVADNYSRNGFRLAVNAANAQHGLELLQVTADRHVRVVFKRVETIVVSEKLIRPGVQLQQTIIAQGYLWDQPKASVVQLNDAERGVIATADRA